MNGPHELPIIFAITGHRDIRPSDEPALSRAVQGIFERFRVRYPTAPFILLTPLAVGADRLVARVAISQRVPLRVPMPFLEHEYRKDFDAAENTDFSSLLGIAEKSYSMPLIGDSNAENVGEPERRARQYAAVGAHLVAVAHVLIALWNGKASDIVGGTAQVVQFRLYGVPNELNTGDVLEVPATGAVYHVVSARQSDPVTEAPVGTLIIKSADGILADGADPSNPLYEKIERFNRDRMAFHLNTAASPSNMRLRESAEMLATHYQNRYRGALNLIFASTTAAAISLAIAHSDQPQYAYALLYVALLAIASVAYMVADRYHWKDRSIEYRALEIGLSIQRVWDLVGLGKSVADFYLSIQRSEFDWIRGAIHTVNSLDDETVSDTRAGVTAVSDFVSSQRAFFAKTVPRDRGQCDRYNYMTRISVWIGAMLTVTLLALSVWSLADFALPPSLAAWSNGSLRAFRDHGDMIIRAIVVATIFAAVFHEYPKRRAFHAQARRYATMLKLYERAHEILCSTHDADFNERLRVARNVISEVGQEALAENGEWLMMHRELPIETIYV